jgi:hypothetical protein
MVFDRLFGTCVEERTDLPPRYGLTTPPTTYNPLRIAFHEWINQARDLRDARGARDVWRALFAPPGRTQVPYDDMRGAPMKTI